MSEIKITSLQNPVVKEFVSLHQKKYRDEKELIILEGEKALLAAQNAGLEIVHRITLENANEKVLEKISTTKSAPKVVAIVKKPNYTIEDFKKLKRIALFEGIKDSGNLGTIIRTACAFGIEGILLYGECTDPFSPKVLRATAGNAFKIPILEIDSLKDFQVSHDIVATVVKDGENIDTIDFEKKLILLFGSEADGLNEELVQIADKKITMDIEKDVESLNLALCAGIFFYEVYKKTTN